MKEKSIIAGIVLSLVSVFSYSEDSAPYVWWGHGDIPMGMEACLQRSHLALEASGYKVNPINKKYGFVYAFKDSVRVGIQCLKREKGTFFYLNAAGPDNDILEKTRNDLVNKIQ